MTQSKSPGAYSAGVGDRKRGGWWKWLLPLLALLALIALLVALLGGGDDDKQSASQPTATATQPAGTPTPDPAAAAGAPTEAVSLTSEGTSLLPPPAGGLAPFAGKPAEGKQVKIQSVVEDEGFFVGTSETDRVYVEYGGDVGENEQEFTPKVGDVVDLTGPVRPAPQDPAQTLNLEAADAQVVEQQGGYVNADEVTPVQ